MQASKLILQSILQHECTGIKLAFEYYYFMTVLLSAHILKIGLNDPIKQVEVGTISKGYMLLVSIPKN